MARCSVCGKHWQDELATCPEDGALLEDDDLGTAQTVAPLPAGPGSTALGVAQTVATPPSADALSTRPVTPRRASAMPLALARAPREVELAPGTAVGEYQIIGKLGEGGMGQVYSATHPLIGKKAAVKVISPELCTDPEAVERFVQEARAANQIGHPNICDAFSFGTLPDGRCYFVMEWLQGESLGDRLRRGRMPLGEIYDLLEQVCRALEAAHEKGIIHRDLKPDNIFLSRVRDEKPIVKLLDFGLAKLTDDGEVQANLTRSGVVMGTPLYLSPEQARGRNVGPATDLYALGVVTYEMVLGRAPFVGESAMDIISMHLHQPPPAPRTIWPDVPATIEWLLIEMLDKDPAQRPTAAVVRLKLAELRQAPLATGEPGRAREPSQPAVAAPPPRRRVAVPVALGVVLGGGAIGVALWQRHATPGGAAVSAPVAPAPVAPSLAAAPAQPVPVQPAPAEREPAQAGAARPAGSAPGSIIVSVDVPATRIELDGRLMAAQAQFARVPAAEGEHRIRVTATGRPPFEQTVTVRSGAELDLPVRFGRGPGRPSRSHAGATGASAVRPGTQPPAASPTTPAAREDDDAPVNPFQKK
jgi:serine/threonine-protein kinase